MKFEDMSDEERLNLGLRLRLKHVRLAMEDAEAGRVAEGFGFAPDAGREEMLAELRRLETEVLGMLRGRGAGEREELN